MLFITPTLNVAWKPLSFKILILVCFYCTQTACSSFRSPPQQAQQLSVIHSTIEEFSAKGSLANEEQTLDLSNSQLWFPAIAGHIYGTPNIDLMWKPQLGNKRVSIQGKQLLTELTEHAKAFDGRETSILITPETTRIARVVPYLLSQFDGEPIGHTDWLNPARNSRLLLVYFDRPCRVLGSLFHNDREVRFDIEIPTSGLYWLEQNKSWFSPEKYVNGNALEHTVLGINLSN